MESNVYFKRILDNDTSVLSKVARELLEVVIEKENILLGATVPIKVHFGERGNTTYVKPQCYEGIIEYLKEKNIKSAFIETNVLYRGSRTRKEDHEKLAKEHGFTQIPVIIADGERGEAYSEVKIEKEFFSSCKIGKAFEEYSQILVTSHFKGHAMAGFGGAIKQLAMGFAARGGKLAQHSEIQPIVREEECISCGECVRKCDVNAILLEPKAKIDPVKCVGCAGCIAVCPVGAIRNDWKGRNFKKKLAEYAYAAQLGKEMIYVNFLINITKECDCIGKHMENIAPDIGIFASKDPVAIDSACLEMLQKEMKEPIFSAGEETLEHGEKIGLGSREYQLIQL